MKPVSAFSKNSTSTASDCPTCKYSSRKDISRKVAGRGSLCQGSQPNKSLITEGQRHVSDADNRILNNYQYRTTDRTADN